MEAPAPTLLLCANFSLQLKRPICIGWVWSVPNFYPRVCNAVAHRGNFNASLLHPGSLREHMPHQSISSVQHVQSPLVLFLSLNELEDQVPNFGHQFPSDVPPLRLVHGTLRGQWQGPVEFTKSFCFWHPAVACSWTKMNRVPKGCPRQRGAVTRFCDCTFRHVAQWLLSHKGILFVKDCADSVSSKASLDTCSVTSFLRMRSSGVVKRETSRS